MSSPLVHFQLATSDPKATEAFMRELFDWEFRPGAGRIAANIDTKHRDIVPNDIQPNGTVLQLPEGAASYTAVFIRVGDLDRVLGRAQELGARVVVPKTRNADGTDVAIFSTPQGLVLGLVQL
jgi:predicted enzyme related to lactoylglutathione lyase